MGRTAAPHSGRRTSLWRCFRSLRKHLRRSATFERNEVAELVRNLRLERIESERAADIETGFLRGGDINKRSQRRQRLADVGPAGSALVRVVVRWIDALCHVGKPRDHFD